MTSELQTLHDLTTRTDEHAAHDVHDVRDLGDVAAVMPRLDAHENAEHYLLLVDLPGVRQEDLSVHLDRGVLTIAGKCAPGTGDAGELLYQEFRRGITYLRKLRVPSSVQADGIVARLEDGVLRLEVPKAADVRPRRIAVSAA